LFRTFGRLGLVQSQETMLMLLRHLALYAACALPLPVLANDVSEFTLQNGLQVVVIEDLVSHGCRRRTGRRFGDRAFSGTPDVQGHRNHGQR
jgi:hypothetical protein